MISQRARALTAATGAAALLVTVLVPIVPALRLTYVSAPLHLIVETLAATVTALAALLVTGRFRRDGRAANLLLALALALLSATTLLRLGPAAALRAAPPAPSLAWAMVLLTVVAGTLFAVSATTPGRIIAHRRRALVASLLATLALAALLALTVTLLAERLPPLPQVSLDRTGEIRVRGYQLFDVAQATLAALFGYAALAFAGRAQQRRDEFFAVLALASMLIAVGRVNYLLVPSIYSSVVYPGDLFHLLAYLVLFVGAAREIVAYWQGLTAVAVFEERRRLARELHDGLVQELGFISLYTRRLRTDRRDVRPIESAAERALGEARRAIAALTSERLESPGEAIAGMAAELANRLGAVIRVDVDARAQIGAAAGENVIRIAREAILNAVLHAHADVIRVELKASDGVVLRVADDGVGFDPAAPPALGHLGLESMGDRARSIGGTLTISSSLGGGGTVVELHVAAADEMGSLPARNGVATG